MKPTGEEVASSVREWMKEEMKKGPSLIHELGRFFFTVSSSTLGFVIALDKITTKVGSTGLLILSFAMLLLSILIALRMAIPKSYDLDGKSDLFVMYEAHMRRMQVLSVCWFLAWLASVAAWAAR